MIGRPSVEASFVVGKNGAHDRAAFEGIQKTQRLTPRF